jgi:1-acyl-sn-glycerol-3-phosphate acyltransferase
VTDLPRPSVVHPQRVLLRSLRPVLRTVARTWWDLHVHGTELVPRRGPVVFASNHVGWLDGPLLAIVAPRSVHAWTKLEMFRGPLGLFLSSAGQIPLDRYRADPRAMKAALRVLADDGTVGVFPEGERGDGELHRFHGGAAYLAMARGAAVVPVTMVGTRVPGGHKSSLPPHGARLDVSFGSPLDVSRVAWPRTREQVTATSMLLWEHLREHQRRTLALLGRTLPGPLPAGDIPDDPDTGFVEQGA